MVNASICKQYLNKFFVYITFTTQYHHLSFDADFQYIALFGSEAFLFCRCPYVLFIAFLS